LGIRYYIFNQDKKEHHWRSPDNNIGCVTLKFINVSEQNFFGAKKSRKVHAKEFIGTVLTQRFLAQVNITMGTSTPVVDTK
jgi:hypothetical protein